MLISVQEEIAARSQMHITYVNQLEELPNNTIAWWHETVTEIMDADRIMEAAKDFSIKCKRPIPVECWMLNGEVWFRF